MRPTYLINIPLCNCISNLCGNGLFAKKYVNKWQKHMEPPIGQLRDFAKKSLIFSFCEQKLREDVVLLKTHDRIWRDKNTKSLSESQNLLTTRKNVPNMRVLFNLYGEEGSLHPLHRGLMGMKWDYFPYIGDT